MIRDGLRRDPTVSLVTTLIGGWMLWYGVTLLTIPITPARRVGFQGPSELLGIRGWGVLFIIGAAGQFVRLLVLQWHRVAAGLNFIPTAVTAAWAFGWFTGPTSTAQPTYTFIALVVLLHPYVRLLAERYYTVTYRE